MTGLLAMAEIFISYVHEDQMVAEAAKVIIETDLKLDGQVFIISDQGQVMAGEEWLVRIKKELSAAKIVILMLSKRSVQRPWVNFEAGAAWILGRTIIPVCFGNQSKGDLPKPYSNFQALQLPDDEQYLINSLADHLGRDRPAPKPIKSTLMPRTPAFEESIAALKRPALDFILSTVWRDEK
jgi:TIR domain